MYFDKRKEKFNAVKNACSIYSRVTTHYFYRGSTKSNGMKMHLTLTYTINRFCVDMKFMDQQKLAFCSSPMQSASYNSRVTLLDKCLINNLIKRDTSQNIQTGHHPNKNNK